MGSNKFFHRGGVQSVMIPISSLVKETPEQTELQTLLAKFSAQHKEFENDGCDTMVVIEEDDDEIPLANTGTNSGGVVTNTTTMQQQQQP